MVGSIRFRDPSVGRSYHERLPSRTHTVDLIQDECHLVDFLSARLRRVGVTRLDELGKHIRQILLMEFGRYRNTADLTALSNPVHCLPTE